MTTKPILSLPDFSKTFFLLKLMLLNSNSGLGTVLIQEKHSVAFFSKALGKRESMKPIYEKELMAIFFAILKWRHYLRERRFVVRTDQSNLKFLLEQREVGTDYQKWVTKIMRFDFEITYNPGASNRVADALSRRDQPTILLGALCSTNVVDWSALDRAVEQDEMLSSI